MSATLTLPLAVEKVLFRLALQEGGAVPIARLFLELPLSLEEVEELADKLADGQTVLKNEWGEFLTYEFPELMDQEIPPPEGCPTCGGEAPPAPTEGGVTVRAPLVCDSCYRVVRRQAETPEAGGRLERLKGFFFGEEGQERPAEVALLEHEIFQLGLQLGLEQFTHTMLAARSRHPAQRLKARLDKMAARRYLQVGLMPSGDTVAYRFPPGLSYPASHYQRLARDERGAPDKSGLLKGPKVTERPRSGLKIVIKDRRSRNP